MKVEGYETVEILRAQRVASGYFLLTLKGKRTEDDTEFVNGVLFLPVDELYADLEGEETK